MEHKIKITWIGHSTFLIEWNGVSILTDPCFANRLAYIATHSMKRLEPPGLKLKDIAEKVDITLITHKHRDHLEYRTLRKLPNSIFIIPKGLGVNFENHKIKNFKEVATWKLHNFKGIKIEAVPMKHWCFEGMHIDYELCFGYVLTLGKKKILFCGDTDYEAILFRKIKKHFGHFDLAFIPIGGYYSYNFIKVLKKIWKTSHINPFQAVQIHRDINSKLSIGMHFGTFKLSKETHRQVLSALASAKRKKKIKDHEFITIKVGETIHL